MPLAVSGAWNAFCDMHAVCSCIKVPLAVSGGRHMAGVAYCKLLHQSAFNGVVCGDIMFCIVYSVFLASGALSGVGCVERFLCAISRVVHGAARNIQS